MQGIIYMTLKPERAERNWWSSPRVSNFWKQLLPLGLGEKKKGEGAIRM